MPREPSTRREGRGEVHLAPTLRSPATELGPRANRTIARILEASRAIFLSRGYAGTTVEEIARVAGLSRASFYTYFPSKRDVLLVLGAESARAGTIAIERIRAVPREWSEPDLAAFVDDYFGMLNEHGSFAFAWTQAAHEDEDIRRAGMKRHLDMCRQLGTIAGWLRGRPFDNPIAPGLVIMGMLERAWSYSELYAGVVDTAGIRRDITRSLASMLRPTVSTRMT